MDKKTYFLSALILILGIAGTIQLWYLVTTTKNLQQQINVSQAKVTQLKFSLDNQDGHWRLAGASYLIDLANIQLHLQHDITAAIYLLERVQQILPNPPEAASQAATAAVTTALHRLKQLKPVPRAEINQRLINLALQIPTLILAPTTNVLPMERVVLPITAPQTGWRGWLLGVLDKLKNLVVLRHSDSVILPLISSDIQALTEQHLLFLLTQTQWAAWQAQGVIYHENLQQLSWLIEHYYRLDNLPTQKVLKTLTELQKIDIAPVLPDLSRVFI